MNSWAQTTVWWFGGGGCLGSGGGDKRDKSSWKKFSLVWQTQNTVCRWETVEFCTWKLYTFVNPNELMKRENKYVNKAERNEHTNEWMHIPTDTLIWF